MDFHECWNGQIANGTCFSGDLPIISSYTRFARRSASFCCISSSFWISSTVGDDDGVGGWLCGELTGGLADGVGRCRLGCFVINIPSGHRIYMEHKEWEHTIQYQQNVNHTILGIMSYLKLLLQASMKKHTRPLSSGTYVLNTAILTTIAFSLKVKLQNKPSPRPPQEKGRETYIRPKRWKDNKRRTVNCLN